MGETHGRQGAEGRFGRVAELRAAAATVPTAAAAATTPAACWACAAGLQARLPHLYNKRSRVALFIDSHIFAKKSRTSHRFVTGFFFRMMPIAQNLKMNS